MRELKFRVFCEHTDRMIEWEYIHRVGILHKMINSPFKVVLQYIGLQDIKGKDIYEGDIVKWGHLKGSEEYPIRIAIVKIDPDIQFQRIKCKTDFAGQNKTFHYGNFAYKNTEKCLEIIGNIYENPELI